MDIEIVEDFNSHLDLNEDCSATDILSLINKDSKVCEIGVAEGSSSRRFLEKGAFVYLIDPFQGYSESEASYNHAYNRRSILNLIKRFPKKHSLIEKKSDDAVNDVPNDLDLIYIDGNHSYEFVKRDILGYWEKLKEGGWMTGDDFSHPGVKDAVKDTLVLLKNKNPNVVLFEFERRCWGIQKI